jgi:hypothetical protein
MTLLQTRVDERAAGLMRHFCQRWQRLRSLDVMHMAAAVPSSLCFRLHPARCGTTAWQVAAPRPRVPQHPSVNFAPIQVDSHGNFTRLCAIERRLHSVPDHTAWDDSHMRRVNRLEVIRDHI